MIVPDLMIFLHALAGIMSTAASFEDERLKALPRRTLRYAGKIMRTHLRFDLLTPLVRAFSFLQEAF